MGKATEDEVRQALGSLGTADLIRLEKAGRYFVRTLGAHANRYDWEALLSEAIVKTLEGERLWNKKVNLTTHLVGSMKSIRSGWAKKGRRTELRDLSDPHEVPGHESDAVRAAEHTEAQRVYADAVNRIGQCFADDALASEVISGLSMGMTGPEIQELSGMSKNEFEAARRRIRRTLDREEDLNARSVLDG